MREKIKKILKELKGAYFDRDTDLISEGYLSSFDIVELTLLLEKTFGITVMLFEVSIEEFDSVESISRIVKKALGNELENT